MVYYDGLSNSGYPLSIHSKYPILETYAAQKNGDVQMSKGVLGVKLLFHGKPLFVFNTHLGIGAKGTNPEMQKVALPFINNVSGDTPTLFGGDFNSPPAIDSPNSEKTIGSYTYSSVTTQSILDAGFTDAYRIAKPKLEYKEDATCPAQDDYIKRVDQVYVRNWNYIPTKTFTKPNPWKYCNKVDHVGVFVEFTLDQ